MNLSIIDGNLVIKPLVSVVIPVFNVEKYLPQCLDSVISQTYQNIEIIVIDDGSTDNSGVICDKYADLDGRIHVFHTNNNGLASARNLGISNAEGTFLSFLDSDDWMEPHAIETLLTAGMHNNADVVVAKYALEYMGKTIHSQWKTDYLNVLRGNSILSAFAKGWVDSVVWNKLYSYGSFSNSRFPDGHNYEDVYTTWKLLKYFAENDKIIVVLPEELFHFRIRKSSITHTKSLKNIIDIWRAYLELLAGLPCFCDRLLSKCFVAIGQMWFNYFGLSHEEKERAIDIVLEMQSFSRAHYRDIIKGNYSFKIKLTCIISQSRNIVLLRLCFYINTMRKFLENLKKKMYE